MVPPSISLLNQHSHPSCTLTLPLCPSEGLAQVQLFLEVSLLLIFMQSWFFFSIHLVFQMCPTLKKTKRMNGKWVTVSCSKHCHFVCSLFSLFLFNYPSLSPNGIRAEKTTRLRKFVSLQNSCLGPSSSRKLKYLLK